MRCFFFNQPYNFIRKHLENVNAVDQRVNQFKGFGFAWTVRRGGFGLVVLKMAVHHQPCDDAQSLPLCGLAGAPRTEGAVTLEPGALLVLYSDGLVERRRESRSVGLDRLRETVLSLHGQPVGRLCDELVRRMRADVPGDDDAVVVSVRFTPTTDRSFRRVVPARSEELAGLRAGLRAWLELAGVPGERHGDVLLLVGEAAANAVEHAYDSERPGVVEVEVSLLGDGSMAVSIADRGAWRPSASQPERGHGTSIMRSLSTSFARRTDGHGTTVEVVLPVADGVAAGS